MLKKNVIVSALFAIAVILAGWCPGKATDQATDASKGDASKVQSTGQETQTGAPKISFLETSFNFGTVSQGDKPSHKFIIRNIGDAPLKLIKAKGS